MRRLAAVVLVGVLALLGLASEASAVAITNGTVTLGVNPSGDLNSQSAAGGPLIGVTFNATGFDGTRDACQCEGWGAGAGGPTPFEGHANQAAGVAGFTQGTFTNTASSAVSVVDILRGETPALRLTQDFHPSPTTPNLYEITTTLENISGGPLSDVRYERIMDWDIEPTPQNEFVTINRGVSPPEALIYSDDDGFSDNNPFTADQSGENDPATINVNYVDKGPADHGARFTFSFGDLAAGETKQFFLYYGAAADEPAANAAVSAAALEVFSYGQPNVPDGDDPDTLPDGPDQGKPNTFIWGFRAVGGSAVIPPTLSLTPESASSDAGGSHSLTARLTDSSGAPVPGAQIVFGVAGPNPASGAGTTGAGGEAGFTYTGNNAGDDTITACLDANQSGACDPDEVTDTATKHWNAPEQTPPPPPPPPPPAPELGKSVVVGVVSGRIRVKGKNGKFRTLGANESIPLGSTVDATKGKVRLTSAANKSGATQSAVFYQGQFAVTQTKGAKPITQLALNGKLSCATKKNKKKKATASAKKKVRRLWGDGKGRFRTKGKHGAATVRGTKWLTEDRCSGTLVRVKRGKVSVRDFVKRRTVLVRQGHVYVARPKPR